MRSLDKNKVLLLVGLLLLFVPTASGQLQVGSETQLNLTGGASLGYVRSWDDQETNSLAYGLNATLTGIYHDPRFLNYTVSPYLNQSNVNSNFNSNTLASGINSQANFLNDSKTPIQFTYARDYNREGTFNVPGSITGFETKGSGQAFSANASYLPEDWPSLHGTFAHTGSDYEILGTPGTGRSHSNLFGVDSHYVLLDTNLSALFTKSWVDSETPVFGSTTGDIFSQNTTQDTLQLNASHQLGRKSTVNGSYGRSHLHGEYLGSDVDTTNNTLVGNLNVTITDKLSAGANAGYSSNLSQQFFSEIIGGAQQKSTGISANPLAGSANGPPSVSFTSEYLTYGANAQYQAFQSLSFIGRVDHRVQGQAYRYPDLTSTTTQAIALYTHRLFGGGFGASYGLSYSITPVYSYANNPDQPGNIVATKTGDSTFMGNSATVSYGRQFGAWSTSLSAFYGEGLTTLLVGYTQTNYGGTGSVTRNVKDWTVSVHGSYGAAKVNGLSIADSKTENAGASIWHKNFGFSGSYGQSSGTALQVGTAFVPTPVPIGTPIQNLLVQFDGTSYSVAGSWEPRRRLNMTASYIHLDYSTINPLIGPLPTRTTSSQYFARAVYGFRQLYLYIGYNHVDQGYGSTGRGSYVYNNFYVGITRYFNFF
jgi:hypothetical protein